MTAAVTVRKNGKAEMAFTGEVPWHGLGERLEPGAPIEEWREAAGMDWEAIRTPVRYALPHPPGESYRIREFPDRDVLLRSDTHDPLSVVSSRYQIFQPAQVLDYFASLAKSGGVEIETAGTLFNGTRFWALANVAEASVVDPHDRVKGRLLLATSLDGTLATTAKFVQEYVVCNNTLTAALAEDGKSARIIHSQAATPEVINAKLGITKPLTEQFADQMALLRALAKTDLRDIEMAKATIHLFDPKAAHKDADEIRDILRRRDIRETATMAIEGQQIGADLDGRGATAYGWLNCVTQQADHMTRAKSQDRRMEKSLFGNGERHKQRAVQIARAMADGTMRYELQDVSDAELLDLITA